MLSIRLRNPQTAIAVERALVDQYLPAPACIVDAANLHALPKNAAIIGVYFDDDEYTRLLDKGIYLLIPLSAITGSNFMKLVLANFKGMGNPSVDFVLTPETIVCGGIEHPLTRVERKFLGLMLHSPDPVEYPDGKGSMGRVIVCRLRKILRSVGSKTQIVSRRGWKQYWLDSSIPSV